MTASALGRDVAATLLPKFAIDHHTVTAGGGADGVGQNGVEIDLTALATRPESVAALVGVKAVLAATETAAVAAKWQERVAGSGDWADLTAFTTLFTLTGGSGGSTERGAGKLGTRLENARSAVRVVTRVTMSASATDTADVAALAAFGGLRDPSKA